MSGTRPSVLDDDGAQRYTLREAAQEIQRRECLWSGHSWDVIETVGGGPVRIACRCGVSHPVGRDEKGSSALPPTMARPSSFAYGDDEKGADQ